MGTGKTRKSLSRRHFLVAGSAAVAGMACSGSQRRKTAHEPVVTGDISSAGQPTVSTDAAVVPTRSGKVRGFVRNGVHCYRGIPYARIRQRFGRAVATEPWDDTRRVLNYGPVCPTGPLPNVDLSANEWAFLIPNGPVTSPMEDCLRMNIWSPSPEPDAHLPVMLWLHADGFGGGSSQDFLSTDGEALARKEEVVVVSVNHRVGALGFLHLGSLGDPEYAESANIGMLDIVDALGWLKKNVAAFGGDPANVTVFGQSGGGFKVSVLLAMPEAQGLFHKAIIQSGARIRVHDESTGTRLAQAVLKASGLPSRSSSIATLQQLTLADFFAATSRATNELRAEGRTPEQWQSPDWWFEPVAGIGSLPTQPFDPSAPEMSSDIPVMCGATLNELPPSVNAPELELMSWEELKEHLQPSIGSKTKTVIDIARRSCPEWSPADVLSIVNSRRFHLAADALTKRLAARKGASVWRYLFSWQTPLFDGRPRAFHGSEVAFAFANTELVDQQTGGGEAPRKLADQMSAQWAAFARTGAPNANALPPWPAYTLTSGQSMILDTKSRTEQHPLGDLLEAIADV